MEEKEIFDDRSNYTIKADGEYTVIEYKERDQINQSQSKTMPIPSLKSCPFY